jgi:hypothetical protein
MAGPGRIKDKPDDNSSRRQPGQGPARADQARQARLAEQLRANLRKRKAQSKAQESKAQETKAEAGAAKTPEKGPKAK